MSTLPRFPEDAERMKLAWLKNMLKLLSGVRIE